MQLSFSQNKQLFFYFIILHTPNAVHSVQAVQGDLLQDFWNFFIFLFYFMFFFFFSRGDQLLAALA